MIKVFSLLPSTALGISPILQLNDRQFFFLLNNSMEVNFTILRIFSTVAIY